MGNYDKSPLLPHESFRGGCINQPCCPRSPCVRKLLKQSSKAGSGNGGIRYFPTFETKSNKLKFIYTAEGRAVPMEKNGFEYQYFLKDHLGNTRVVLSQSGKVLQQNSYYPFGMLMEGLNTVPDYDPYQNKYLYNGKELQTDFGLDWYDYGARFYDAALGRWNAIDPKAEVNRRWSPYRYAYDNPLRFLDPAGMLEDDWKKNGDGTWTAEQGDGAETLAQDAGISKEKAYKIMDKQGHGTYVDKKKRHYKIGYCCW